MIKKKDEREKEKERGGREKITNASPDQKDSKRHPSQ
jgi:hypothetical protein